MIKKTMALALALALLSLPGCRDRGPAGRALQADVPLHLEEHLDSAQIFGSEVPKDIPAPSEWHFDREQPGWKTAVSFRPGMKPVQTARLDDALRLTLTQSTLNPMSLPEGYIYVDLPNWTEDDWGLAVIQARTDAEGILLGLRFNLRLKPGDAPTEKGCFLYGNDPVTLIADGEVHTYVLPLDDPWSEGRPGTWKQLGLAVSSYIDLKKDAAKGPEDIDILSVAVIPRMATYSGAKAGVSGEKWSATTRRALFTHAPGRLDYLVKVPDGGRLDLGLGLLKKANPVKFKISVRDGRAGSAAKDLFTEMISDPEVRVDRSVALSDYAGRTVVLSLETEAEKPGNVAFWGSPTICGKRATSRPNIVLYVIDGANADIMSVYGHNRLTTPHIAQLAAEGALFENAYSNSSWTKISVPSFMTSLHSSVLGPFRTDSDPLPEQAVPMAERMHKAGYITEVLTSNPYVGRMSSLDRGVDAMADSDNVPASDLQREFWRLRDAYPGEPFWVHFQPTDVHGPTKIVEPFAGLFVTAEERKIRADMLKSFGRPIPGDTLPEKMTNLGLDPATYAQIDRKLEDEAMAYQDHQIGRLVERLKTVGEWENTLFIVAADHGKGTFVLSAYDPARPKYWPPLLTAKTTKIPLIFVWPGKIAPGQRFVQPVSMIDLLPTVLDLAGLPPAEIAQGQSLAPLLLGKPGWTPRPVVFDEFSVDEPYYYGSIEVIDGRWGASLAIDPRPDEKKRLLDRLRPAPLLVFDIWDDPQAFRSLHAERPDLVEKYSKMLKQILQEHETLAKKFSRTGSLPLTQGQIETLRSLGYIK